MDTEMAMAESLANTEEQRERGHVPESSVVYPLGERSP